MRAYVFILMAITGTMLMSCHDTTEGYLKTDSARYVPDTMEIRLQLDETLDAYRMHNMAPWVSPKLQGVTALLPSSSRWLRWKLPKGVMPSCSGIWLTCVGEDEWNFR